MDKSVPGIYHRRRILSSYFFCLTNQRHHKFQFHFSVEWFSKKTFKRILTMALGTCKFPGHQSQCSPCFFYSTIYHNTQYILPGNSCQVQNPDNSQVAVLSIAHLINAPNGIVRASLYFQLSICLSAGNAIVLVSYLQILSTLVWLPSHPLNSSNKQYSEFDNFLR